jgi:hypothetical protein
MGVFHVNPTVYETHKPQTGWHDPGKRRAFP